MFKSFGVTLAGPALQWLINLKPGSIANFSSLINKFYQQFATSRELEKQSSNLYRVIQKRGDSIRSYWDKFNREMITIKSCDTSTSIEAFRRGLHFRSRLYQELSRYPYTTFEEVRSRSMAKVQVEEDEEARGIINRTKETAIGETRCHNGETR